MLCECICLCKRRTSDCCTIKSYMWPMHALCIHVCVPVPCSSGECLYSIRYWCCVPAKADIHAICYYECLCCNVAFGRQNVSVRSVFFFFLLFCSHCMCIKAQNANACIVVLRVVVAVAWLFRMLIAAGAIVAGNSTVHTKIMHCIFMFIYAATSWLLLSLLFYFIQFLFSHSLFSLKWRAL